MIKKELVNLLDELYKFDNKEDWDICGINNKSDDLNEEISNVLISLDLTSNLVNEAILNKSNVIITHHPLFLNLFKSEEENKKNIELFNKLKDNKITHISLHTCYDAYKFGTSYNVSKKISDFDIKPTDDKYAVSFELKNEKKLKSFVNDLRKSFELIKYDSSFDNKNIKKVVLLAGSGSDYLYQLVDKDVDCFLTGDVGWHQYIDAKENDIAIVDIGHSEEKAFCYDVFKLLNKYELKTKIIDINIKLSN